MQNFQLQVNQLSQNCIVFLIAKPSPKAIVNRLREVYHRPATVPLTETGALFKLEVALLKDKVTLTLDTTGPSLFKRGYRIEKGAHLLRKTWQLL